MSVSVCAEKFNPGVEQKGGPIAFVADSTVTTSQAEQIPAIGDTNNAGM